jgi:ceramide synthetase
MHWLARGGGGCQQCLLLLLLLLLLHACRYWRVGSIIMLLNDAADIFMEAAKVAKYCNKEGLATALFAAFTAAFLLLRLGWFPFMVIRSTLFEAPVVLPQWPPQYYSFNALLLVLLVLNCYWFSLVLRIAWLKLTTGSAHDVREDEE